VKKFFQRRSSKVREKDPVININNEDAAQGQRGADASEEAKAAPENAATDAEFAKVTADLDDLRQTLMRRQADFDNYRKRIEKERAEDSKRYTARVVEGLIPIIDGFEHALAAHREAEYENYRKGFERVDPLGKPFDPHLHQAMDRTETVSHEDGTILQVFQPGYIFHGRVLRPAMVRVAVHPGGASKEAAN
jgi:molecular chaperone GrpE